MGTVKVLLVVIALLIGGLASVVAAWLARASGKSAPGAVVWGGATFAATVTLMLAIEGALGALE